MWYNLHRKEYNMPNTGYGNEANQATAALQQRENADGKPQDGGGPVVAAIKVIAQFIQAQIDKGNPDAAKWKQALLGLLAMIQQPGAAGAQPKAPAPAPQSPGEEVAAQNRGQPPQGNRMQSQRPPNIM
jgi:hypothetical protein